jgi:hypothetical protein
MNFKLTLIVIKIIVVLNSTTVKSIEFSSEKINFYRKLGKIIYDLENHINHNNIDKHFFDDIISSKLLVKKIIKKLH